jgi:A/G-specific adenine glycosylase
MLTDKEITDFQESVFSWWRKNNRDLPWRHTRDPYAIHVSELMLQQTQVSRVLPKYAEFLSAFPTVSDLASASLSRVLFLWKGLGYNRRAKYLHSAANTICTQYFGIYPSEEQKLLQLPGLGTYTARAILVFAFNQQLAFVDTNIRQIITHHFYTDVPQTASVINNTANLLLPKGKAWEWHQALMDYGSIALSALVPKRSVHITQKKSLPFRESRRFYRGRIIDALRERSLSTEVLIQTIEKSFGKGKWDLSQVIETLIKEGLVEKDKRGVLRLG